MRCLKPDSHSEVWATQSHLPTSSTKPAHTSDGFWSPPSVGDELHSPRKGYCQNSGRNGMYVLISNPGFPPPFTLQEQYEFCYKVVQEYIDAFSDYANFK